MMGFFTKNAEEFKKNVLGLVKVEAIYFPSITLLIGLSTLLTIMIGGLYYIKGGHGIGVNTIVEFVMYINMLTFPVSAIGLTASMIQRAAASQKRINEFLETEPAVRNGQADEKPILKGEIRFEQVDFVYPNTGIRAIQDFNLAIRPGEKIAIVGRTGSGKTTLAQLLLRMIDVTGGRIELDGTDIRQINLADLREQISYVPQDVFLFSGSVADNVTLRNPSIPREEVIHAAKLIGIHPFIMQLPGNYDYNVMERGATLSLGQRQLLSFVRALLYKPAVLILDEATSSVDSESESLIQHAIDTLIATG